MQPFDIAYATFTWKNCDDMRPWLVVECTPDGSCNCFPISGQDYGGDAFKVDQGDPDFPATGLTKTCYIHDQRFYAVSITAFGKCKGVLTGQLLTRFLAHAGL